MYEDPKSAGDVPFIMRLPTMDERFGKLPVGICSFVSLISRNLLLTCEPKFFSKQSTSTRNVICILPRTVQWRS